MTIEIWCTTVQTELFYEKLDELKAAQKKKESLINLFIEDSFYEKAKTFLKHQHQQEREIPNLQPHHNEGEHEIKLTKYEKATIERKKWSYNDDSLLNSKGKKVVPKNQLYDVLRLAHNRIAHRGREITAKWINNNFAEVNLRVVNLFVSLCRFHAEQKCVTSRVKTVQRPLQSPLFLSLIEIDLMDFRNCECDCTEPHKWAVNITDHHTKFVYVAPIHFKSPDEVTEVLQTFCFIYGFPQKIISDNGKEFNNKKMQTFCKENSIELAHGTPQTPTTRSLVEGGHKGTYK